MFRLMRARRRLYCFLIAYDELKKNFADYIDLAFKKRGEIYNYERFTIQP